jgi:hypothetical protein
MHMRGAMGFGQAMRWDICKRKRGMRYDYTECV